MKTFIVLVIFTMGLASATAQADCEFVQDTETGQMIWACSGPEEGSCGWVLDTVSGQMVWACNN